METRIRYEVHYEDSQGSNWYTGKESGVNTYEQAKKRALQLKKDPDVKRIYIRQIVEVRGVYEEVL